MPRQADNPANDDDARLRRANRFRYATITLVIALIALGLAWEMVLAPLRPQGSLLALKVVPLVFALPALRRGWVRAYQLWVMLILVYVCEGIVRGMSDTGLSATLAWIETALSVACYLSMMLYVRARRGPRNKPHRQSRVEAE